MSEQKLQDQYDVAIVGAGPAALSASVYLSRYRLSNIAIGPEIGGYVSTTHLVEDYLGFKSISGLDLASTYAEHAKEFGGEQLLAKVTGITKKDGLFHLQTWTDQTVPAKAVLIATGTEHNKLGKPGEDKFEGRGVSYCVTCDAAFFRNKRVAIVGGGDSGAKGALHLSEFASEVFWIHRRDKFKAEPIWVERVQEKSNVTFVMENEIEEVVGEQIVESVRLKSDYQGSTTLPVDGVFVEIGSTPSREIPDMVGAAVDEYQNLIVNDHQRTTAENVWGAGDNTTASAMFRQIMTAAAEGSIAAGDMYEYLNDSRANWQSKGTIGSY